MREEREKYEKALETLDAAEKRIKRDPEFGRMVQSHKNDAKLVLDFVMEVFEAWTGGSAEVVNPTQVHLHW